MPFIPQKPTRPKAELKVSIDKEVRDEFAQYSRFLDSQRGDESYAVEGILKKVMQYDREFQSWLKQEHPGVRHPQTETPAARTKKVKAIA